MGHRFPVACGHNDHIWGPLFTDDIDVGSCLRILGSENQIQLVIRVYEHFHK